MDTIAKWARKRVEACQPVRSREQARRPDRDPLRFAFYSLRSMHHINVIAQLHHSCTVSSPLFENAFHYSLSSSHLQNPIRKTVQFLVDIASTIARRQSPITFPDGNPAVSHGKLR
jgi:hypothetical protein